MKLWDVKNIDNLNGKLVIVTGASDGIGLEATKVLAFKEADIIMAVRNMAKGEKAADSIRNENPKAKVVVSLVDLADLASVTSFAENISASYGKIDILINNAGVMIPPYSKTKDGFEMQFGINHLGHYALTGRLLPLLLAAPFSRVITVSSLAALKGYIDFDNLDGSRGYNAMRFYRQSKYANLLFAVELQHRLAMAQKTTLSVACHPGLSITNILSRGSGRRISPVLKYIMKLVAQPADKGALPTLFAATFDGLRGGEFIEPDGHNNRKGDPVATDRAERLFNHDVSARLWEISEKLTGVKYHF